jgi:hypothetical protein
MRSKLRGATLVVALAAALAGFIGFGSGAALAKQPKTTICHPVGSATGGNTHAGYSIITTANPSAHIDEETGAPKHEHDGRVDFIVDAEHPCPPAQASPSPSPSPSVSPTPSPTPAPSESPSPAPAHGPKKNTPGNGGTALTGASSEAIALGLVALALAAVGVSAVITGRKRT